MLTRRNILKKACLTFLAALVTNIALPGKWASRAWAQARQLLPKGFPRSKIVEMHPGWIDNRDLEIDPLDQFGTMGPTDVSIDWGTYRLKVTGEVIHPLSLSYDEILKLPSITEDVLLICPGFFSNHGRWTGVYLKDLLEEAQLKKEALFLDIKGHGKEMRIRIDTIYRKNIFLAYQVNGEPLPKKHGFPLRLVYPDVYGDDWIKYVHEIVVAPMPKPDF
jgi:DMSO/TMAO reductase YedYZ molybdopterin-dependent catalytic subunit